MIKYLITTFAILWFCNSPRELIHIAILAVIITLLASFQVQHYYIDPSELENEDENDN